jgi:hypothetical protein
MVIDSCNWRNTGPDLEIVRRSAGAWTRIEVADCGRNPTANQLQIAALNLYLPLHSNGLYDPDPYALRSVSTNGTLMSLGQTAKLNDPNHKFDDLAAKAASEIKRLRPLTLGDFYPLSPIDLDESHWMAWQFDRPESGDGFAIFLRRPHAPDDHFQAALHALDPKAQYEVEFFRTYDLEKRERMTGSQLRQVTATIPKPQQSLLIVYTQTPTGR